MFATTADINRAMVCSEKEEGSNLPLPTHIAVRFVNAWVYDDIPMHGDAALFSTVSVLAVQMPRPANSFHSINSVSLPSVPCTSMRPAAGATRSLHVKIFLLSYGNNTEQFPMAFLFHHNMSVGICASFFVTAHMGQGH